MYCEGFENNNFGVYVCVQILSMWIQEETFLTSTGQSSESPLFYYEFCLISVTIKPPRQLK